MRPDWEVCNNLQGPPQVPYYADTPSGSSLRRQNFTSISRQSWRTANAVLIGCADLSLLTWALSPGGGSRSAARSCAQSRTGRWLSSSTPAPPRCTPPPAAPWSGGSAGLPHTHAHQFITNPTLTSWYQTPRLHLRLRHGQSQPSKTDIAEETHAQDAGHGLRQTLWAGSPRAAPCAWLILASHAPWQ